MFQSSYIPNIAAATIRAALPQTAPKPWRGGEGAEALMVPFANGLVADKITLRKEAREWWATATFKDRKPVEEFASNAGEAMRKLKKALLAM